MKTLKVIVIAISFCSADVPLRHKRSWPAEAEVELSGFLGC